MKIIEKGHYYKAYRGKFRKKYFTYEAKKLVKNYWRFHFRYLEDYHEGREVGPIDEDGLCQCITLGLFNRTEIRFFLFVSTFFDLLIERHFRDSYSEFREYYNFPEIWSHGGWGGVGPDWFLNYDQFDYKVYKKHKWNYNHEYYGFIIKDIFDILLNEILQFFSSKNLQSDKLINHIKLKFEQWYEPEDRKMLSNIINEFLNKEDIY